MSAFGVKRTWAWASQMSAFDPKWTLMPKFMGPGSNSTFEAHNLDTHPWNFRTGSGRVSHFARAVAIASCGKELKKQCGVPVQANNMLDNVVVRSSGVVRMADD